MAPDDLNPADLDQLVDIVAGDTVDLPTALDPTDLSLPGAWVTLDTIGPGTLQSAELGCRVVLIAPNVLPTQALAILAPLYNTAKARLRAAGITVGAASTVPVVIPGLESAQLPGLSIPVTFNTTQTAE